jgi:hypothetical protein
MTLTLEISPELEKRLREEASRRGLGAPEYALSVLEGTLAEHSLTEENGNAWAILESMKGTVEGPVDWAAELDHYLYGTPKRSSSPE